MVFVDIDKGEQAQQSEGADDGTLTDKTACLTDDISTSSCVEVKAGIAIRFESNHIPGAMSDVSIRIGVESIMNEGTISFLAYTDFNSVTLTDKVVTVNITGGGDVDTLLTQAFLDQIGTTFFTARMAEDGSGAKIKTAELDIEFTLTLVDLIAESRDDDDNIVGSTGVNLFRRTGTFPYTYTQTDSATTHATLGTHTFQYEDDDEFYRIFYMKELSPDEWDMSDEVKGT